MSKPLILSAVAAFSLATGAAEGAIPSRIDGLAYSGDRVPGAWEGDPDQVIDLATLKKADGNLPLLWHHDQWSDQIGTIPDVRITTEVRIGADLFSDCDDTAKAIALKAKRGVEGEPQQDGSDHVRNLQKPARN